MLPADTAGTPCRSEVGLLHCRSHSWRTLDDILEYADQRRSASAVRTGPVFVAVRLARFSGRLCPPALRRISAALFHLLGVALAGLLAAPTAAVSVGAAVYWLNVEALRPQGRIAVRDSGVCADDSPTLFRYHAVRVSVGRVTAYAMGPSTIPQHDTEDALQSVAHCAQSIHSTSDTIHRSGRVAVWTELDDQTAHAINRTVYFAATWPCRAWQFGAVEWIYLVVAALGVWPSSIPVPAASTLY